MRRREALARRVAGLVLGRELAHQQDLRERFAQLPVDGAGTVLAGDSLAAAMPLLDLFTPLRNRGVPGETVAEVRARLPELLARRPGRLLLLAGANDLLRGATADAVADALDAMLTDAARLADGTALAVVSVLPMRSAAQARVPSPAVIQAVNARLRASAERLGVAYLDGYAQLADDGGDLPAALTTDGVHLTAAGYRALAPAIAGHF